MQTEEKKFDGEPEEFFVPQFGFVPLSWLDLSEKYQGLVFELSADVSRGIAETLGFTANFDNAAVKSATIDILKSELVCTFEIARNAKPNDITLRYSRERWEALEQVSDSSRPWIKTTYLADSLAENALGMIAEQLSLKIDLSKPLVIRLDLKDKKLGLVCKQSNAEYLPFAAAVSTFSLPTAEMFAITKIVSDESPPIDDDDTGESEVSASEPIKLEEAGAKIAEETKQSSEPKTAETENKEQRREQMESSAKYATYSRSEIDQMLKQQAETVANALGSKISSQQRVFQDAVEKQEKTFAKISDDFVLKFDQTRTRLEAQSKQSEDLICAELDTFKKDLSKELEHFRGQLNKTVLPVAKFIEDKNASPVQKKDKKKEDGKDAARAELELSKTVSQSAASDPGLRPILYIILALSLFCVAALFGVVMPQVGKIEALQSELSELRSRVSEIQNSNTKGFSSTNSPINSSSKPLSTQDEARTK